MPEGPEIRIAADSIARVLQGQLVQKVFLQPPLLRSFKLQGATVTAVDTCGKAMLTRFDNALTLYSHNQLYGKWYVCRAGSLPRTNRNLRVALHTAAGSALLYSATDIAVLNSAQLAVHPFLCRLGPDILDARLSAQILADRLDEKRFRSRSLAALYLDQTFVAGIGNYLRSEILHFAGLSHMRRPLDLTVSERQRLARQTLAVARRSYRTRGITSTPTRIRARSAAGDTCRSENRFTVFARDGEACDVCGAMVQRAQASSRRIYFCPHCQR